VAWVRCYACACACVRVARRRGPLIGRIGRATRYAWGASGRVGHGHIGKGTQARLARLAHWISTSGQGKRKVHNGLDMHTGYAIL
jgi:hypothetical protein